MSLDSHSPQECNKYVTHIPLSFSHKRFFYVLIRKILLSTFSNRPFLSASSVAKLCDIRITSSWGLFWYKLWWRFFKSIYLRSDLLELFLKENVNRLNAKVVVIGGTDRNFYDFNFEFPESVRLILCQNNSFKASNLFTLPLGLEDRELGRAGLKRFHTKPITPEITNRVFVPPMSPTNSIRRSTILECMKRREIFDVFIQLMDENLYFSIAQKYRFVLCLEGNGFENHRVWETLYRGGIPVLLKTSWSESLAYLQLPIVLVASMDEVDAAFLKRNAEKYSQFVPSECKALWTPFWQSVISGRIELSKTS